MDLWPFNHGLETGALANVRAFFAATMRRNNFLLGQIRTSIVQGRRTMVIYGEGHLRATAVAIQRGVRVSTRLPLNCVTIP